MIFGCVQNQHFGMVVTLWPLKNGGNGDEPWDGMGYFQTNTL